MKKFTHLHLHSQYSLLDGLPKIDELLNYIKSLGMDSVAITDHGNIYGAVEFYKKAKEKGVKPIIGSELYQAFEGMKQMRPNIDNKRYHLVLLVKNKKGYQNLVKLITKSYLEGFYYKPRIDEELLKEHSEGLIGLSACLQGKIAQFILANKISEAERQALLYQDIFGKGNFYLEIQHHPSIKEQEKVNKAVIEISRKINIPLIATGDCHYLRPEDAEAQDILMLINTGADPNDPERLTMKKDDFSVKSPEKMWEYFKDFPEALENTQKVTEECNFELELKTLRLPKFDTPNNQPPYEYLRELAYKGLEKRYGKNPDQKIIERLEYELKAIEQTGFASYFLIVQDFVNWAKQNRIVVGPGRGSVGGSLVAHLLNITSIDPLKYNLLFERFINPERVSPPDIDLDFTDRRRDEVLNYVSQKYGQNRVAQIITFGTMAAKAVVRDVGRALGYPYSFCDKIAKMIPFGLTLDQALAQVQEFRQLYLEDEKVTKLIDLAKKLEGVVRHASTHACGVVISNEPLDDIVPLQHPTQDDKSIVTQYEMHSIEDLGLLKIDLLGLRNLTIIEDTLSRIYKVRGKNIDIQNIPLDDKETFKLLQKAETVSVFQLESDGMRRYLKELKPTDLEDIIAMVALYRPGPMQFISDYIAGKHGKRQIKYMHPKLKPILEKTYGVCIFQEQLMEIAKELAGFTLGEADILRKAVGKKIKKLLTEQETKMIEGMIKNGIPELTARKIWQWVLPFARYGFNKSHSAAYALIAYQTAYLKAHFPTEFMASVLTSEKADVERIGFLIQECKRMGIEVLPPDINESLQNFTVAGEKRIRFGLLVIKNVGQQISETIVKERKENGPYKSISDFIYRINSKDLNKKSFESLIKAGVFDRFAERNQLLENMDRLLEISRENQKTKSNGQIGLFGLNTKINDIRLKPAPPASKREKLHWEKELLGLFVTSHPLEDYKTVIEKNAMQISKISPSLLNKKVKVGGIISEVKKIITKKGQPMLFVKLEDLSDKIELVAFPSILQKNPLAFEENKIVIVSGKVDNKEGIPKIIAEDIQEIIEA
jgi:DNA polymerase-3 subunit alpha